MTRSKRIQGVKGIAHNREQVAARDLGEKRRVLEEHRKRLEDLLSYRDEYARHFHQSAGQGIDARQLNEYHAFLEKLNQAITQQRERVDIATNACQASQKNWLSRRTHTQALDKVVERYASEEFEQAEKKQQRELDDHVGRKVQPGFDK